MADSRQSQNLVMEPALPCGWRRILGCKSHCLSHFLSLLIFHLSKHSAHTSVPRYVAVKIATLDIDAAWETRISRLIANAEPSHEGLNFIRTHLDKFQLPGEGGTHSCLVYTPMRETLFQLQHRLRGQRFAPPLFKFFMYCLLEAVDYLHTECHLIHTGKPSLSLWIP